MSDIVIRYFIAVLHFAGEKTLENAGLWGGGILTAVLLKVQIFWLCYVVRVGR